MVVLFSVSYVHWQAAPSAMNTVSIHPPETGHILPLQNKETILVVDDQPALCKVAEIFLTRCGYRVITAHDPLQAKMQVRQNPNIDLLLTDIEMPGMFGDELAEWFRKANPHGAVVFMSGNSMHRLRLKEYPFIEKPFIHLDALVKIVRNILGQAHSTREAAIAAA